jgi:four helix bundle protein
MRKENIAYEKAYAFALKVIKACEIIRQERREFVLSRQLIRSATSIGANLAEAEAAISGADLSSKASIAYKECRESKNWKSLLQDANYLDPNADAELIEIPDEISRILFSTIRTLRFNQTKTK